MKHVRKRLTYANVMSSIAVFLVLGGATALAAGQLGKNSVGPKQLKANAVTTTKIKKGAVTALKLGGGAVGSSALAKGAVTGDKLGPSSVGGSALANDAVSGAKIAANAVTGDKIAPGSVTGADINSGSAPFGQVVARIRGNTAQLLTTTFSPYPLANPTFTQPAGMNATMLGALDVVFPAGCTQPRSAAVYLSVDSPTPATLNGTYIAGVGQFQDTGTGTVARRVEIPPYIAGMSTLFEPNADTPHTFSLLVQGTCTAGSGINATAAGIDVIGTR
jgi:hypothetical protein